VWRIDDATVAPASDLARFVATVDAQRDFFDATVPILVARAPGRLDLMGGIADYSGALVLQLPLAAATFVAAQRADDGCITIKSLALGPDAEAVVSLPATELVSASNGKPLDYTDARALFAKTASRRWAAYVAGALVVLARERAVRMDRGVRLLVDSAVPLGKGVSSSAALEVAAMVAFCGLLGVSPGGRDLALLCQMVENLVVGAPCGIMDQMTAACGERDRLLALRCQPAELEAPVILPPSLEVWGIDSGIRHEVGGADYGAVRVGAFMGYRIIADAAGLPFVIGAGDRVHVDDDRWHGYLANVTPAEWESTFRSMVPEVMTGASFLRRFGGITDTVTRVDPAASYAVRQPTAHPIYEHHRVRLFRALLASGAESEEQRQLLGELMYQSHASYGACGLGSSGTDRLVDLVHAGGPTEGLYGAKITGGGSGGVVAVLARAGSRPVVERIAREYQRQSGRSSAVLGGSSDGAARFGVKRLVHETPATALVHEPEPDRL
jgi:galactokinase